MNTVSSFDIRWQAASRITRPWRRLLSSALVTVGVTLLQAPAQGAQARFTLLSANDLRQFVALSYNYQDSLSDYRTGKSSSTNHGFSESYSISASYSILHPRLLRGDASVGLISNQELIDKTGEGVSSSSDNRISYSVNGIMLDRSPFPVNFGAESSTLTMRPPLSRAYTVDSQNQHVSLKIRKKFFPAHFSYARNESTTSGLLEDIKQSSQTASLSLSQNADGLSSTRGALSRTFSEQTLLGSGTTDSRDEISGNLRNTLTWDNWRGLQRRLDTSYSYREESGSYPGTQSSFSSGLGWQIGKALDSRLVYNQSSNKNAESNNSMHGVIGSLTQKYLDCLQTNLGGALGRGSYSDGSDLNASWNAGVSYSNVLPRDSRIGLSYGYQYALQDRTRTAFSLKVVEAVPLTAPFPQFLDLAASNIDSGSIALYRDAGQTLPFTDFSIVLSGVRTRILINSDPGVPVLYLNYSHQQSPEITFSSSGHAIGGRLSLFGARHLLHADYSWSDTRIIDGSDPNSTIGGSTHLKVGLESKLPPHTASLEYASDRNIYQDLQYIHANWTHTLNGRNASLLTRADDRYSWYANKEQGRASHQGWDNTFLLSTAFSRSVIRNVTGKLTLDYLNLLTDSVSSNNIGLGIGLVGNYGRTFVSLDGSTNWSFSSSGTARNQSVSLNARRSF